MTLFRLSCIVILLVGGTAAAVTSYVESLRPVPIEPTAVEREQVSLPALPEQENATETGVEGERETA
jgi:hypothetical protein